MVKLHVLRIWACTIFADLAFRDFFLTWRNGYLERNVHQIMKSSSSRLIFWEFRQIIFYWRNEKPWKASNHKNGVSISLTINAIHFFVKCSFWEPSYHHRLINVDIYVVHSQLNKSIVTITQIFITVPSNMYIFLFLWVFSAS